MEPASLDVVIVNFRTPAITADCLRSLAAVRAEEPALRVVLVENGSGDDSFDRLKEQIAANRWEPWVTLLRSEENLGFAGGNNLGIRWVFAHEPRAQYVLLLNSDTLVHAGVLQACRAVMTQNRGIGMMSCRLVCADGSIQTINRRFPSPLRQTLCALGLPWYLPGLFGWANGNDRPAGTLHVAQDCDWIGGAFMYIDRLALEKVGLLDESFFFYGEDIEFCHRFRKAGYRVRYEPATAITHLGGGSSDPTRLASRMRSRRAWQARYLVQRKCYGAVAAGWIRFVDLSVYHLKKLKLLCMGRRKSAAYADICEALAILRQGLDTKA